MERHSAGKVQAAEVDLEDEMIEMNRISDDELEAVSGGARKEYGDEELKKSGVIVAWEKRQKVYKVRVFGQLKTVGKGVAFSIADCYALSGGMQLSDQQLSDLITQS